MSEPKGRCWTCNRDENGQKPSSASDVFAACMGMSLLITLGWLMSFGCVMENRRNEDADSRLHLLEAEFKVHHPESVKLLEPSP